MFIIPDADDFKAYFYRDFPFTDDLSDLSSITDTDIDKAIGQASVVFNSALFDDQNSFTIGYLYLTAHYLVIDLRTSSQGIAGGYSWLTNSKAVGSVSESFSIPQQMMDNPVMAMLSKTNYGAKYLSLLLPQLLGQMFPVCGATHP